MESCDILTFLGLLYMKVRLFAIDAAIIFKIFFKTLKYLAVVKISYVFGHYRTIPAKFWNKVWSKSY